MSEGRWVSEKKDSWICRCTGTWYRPKSLIICRYCNAIRPQPQDGQEKILDRALRKIFNESQNKEGKK